MTLDERWREAGMTTRAEYAKRLAAVRAGEPSCHAPGRFRSRCVREPGHDGPHEGQGYDEFGPKYWFWANDA